MDISAIRSISIQTVDWSRLTARQIIEYENEGVEVPSQYLLWAQEFLASIGNLEDETTYDMVNPPNESQPTSTEPTVNPDITTGTSTTTSENTSTDTTSATSTVYTGTTSVDYTTDPTNGTTVQVTSDTTTGVTYSTEVTTETSTTTDISTSTSETTSTDTTNTTIGETSTYTTSETTTSVVTETYTTPVTTDTTTDTTDTTGTTNKSETTPPSEETSEDVLAETPDEDKTPAQAKRDSLNKDGLSLYNQTKIFTQDSETAASQAVEAQGVITNAQNSSQNTIQNLDSYMEALLANAQGDSAQLKNEMGNVNKDFARINQLQNQLKQYLSDGNAQISSADADFNQYQSIINAQGDLMFSARDFGIETVSLGNELLSSVSEYNSESMSDYKQVGNKAVSTGKNAQDSAQVGDDLKNSAQSINSQNMSSASGYRDRLNELTSFINEEPKNDDESSKDTVDGKTPESEKDVKTSQNDGTDDTDKLHISLDEILKRKIRRGEEF